MGPSEKTQHAIRRSTRLPLEVPVLLTSLDPAAPFSEQCHTTLVNAHGCGLIVPRAIGQGLKVRLEIASAKRHTTARVAEVVPLGGDPETWLAGLELDVPGNFWGIEYAPSDWKIEESPAPAAIPTKNGSAADQELGPAALAAHSRRWRLTDITAGACYLETAVPFPADTPVLLSIRGLEGDKNNDNNNDDQNEDKEFLLDGVVRVSHPQTGMGVEFTASPGRDQRAKVEELIARLTSTRKVPKIFLGRKESRKKEDRSLGHRSDEDDAAANPALDAAYDAESHDPLLRLIRSGAALTAEQFLNALRAQRLGNRPDRQIDGRIEIALPVLLAGTDVRGRPLDQRVMTISISRREALLEGIHGMLAQGDIISLARLHKKEQFRVAWVAGEETPAAGQISVAAVDPDTSFWSEVIEASGQSAPATGPLPGYNSEKVREKSRGKDHGTSSKMSASRGVSVPPE